MTDPVLPVDYVAIGAEVKFPLASYLSKHFEYCYFV